MASIQDVSAEQLAKVFHYYREALADDFAHRGSNASSSWDQAPDGERKLMVAAAHLTLQELNTELSQDNSNRKYFANPGEADWGC